MLWDQSQSNCYTGHWDRLVTPRNRSHALRSGLGEYVSYMPLATINLVGKEASCETFYSTGQLLYQGLITFHQMFFPLQILTYFSF